MSELPEETGALAAELRRLPTPMPSPALVERVRRIAHLEIASRADEKLNRLVLVFLLVFSWTLALVGFFAVRVVASGTVSVLGLAALQTSSMSWSVVYFAAAWVSGAILFVVLGVQYRRMRRVV